MQTAVSWPSPHAGQSGPQAGCKTPPLATPAHGSRLRVSLISATMSSTFSDKEGLLYASERFSSFALDCARTEGPKAFTFLRQEIAKREKELAGLKAEATQWKNV